MQVCRELLIQHVMTRPKSLNKRDIRSRLVDLPNVQGLVFVHALVHLVGLESFGGTSFHDIGYFDGLAVASQITDELIDETQSILGSKIAKTNIHIKRNGSNDLQITVCDMRTLTVRMVYHFFGSTSLWTSPTDAMPRQHRLFQQHPQGANGLAMWTNAESPRDYVPM